MNGRGSALLSKVCLLLQRGQWPLFHSKSVICIFAPNIMDTFKTPHISFHIMTTLLVGRLRNVFDFQPSPVIFLLTDWLIQPSVRRLPVAVALRVKRLGLEADHSPHLNRY
jgi:hypothetical protein